MSSPTLYLYISDATSYLTAAKEGFNSIELSKSDSSCQMNAKVIWLVAQEGNGDQYPPILGSISIQRGGPIFKIERTFTQLPGFEDIRHILNRPLPKGFVIIKNEEYEAIIQLLGDVLPPEKEFLAYIKLYIAARGYYFDDETLINYHICLKTRPFVILAGLSGTGKSKLSQLYAEAVGSTVQNDRYLRLAVRPNWNDDRYLLGYFNTITNEYIAETALDFLWAAERDREHLYFLCLDEMNLAHVEHYFSQFLSALEEDSPTDRRIPLMSSSLYRKLEQDKKAEGIEPFAIIPPNLLFIGTINVDETTQPISDKVIDRANTIEFFSVDLTKVPEQMPTPDTMNLSNGAWQRYITTRPDPAFQPLIVEIGKILNRANMGLGFRVLKDINLFIANSRGLLDPKVAFDLQVKQRILPRLRGSNSEKTQQLFEDFISFSKHQKLIRTEQRLTEMKDRLMRDGYTSFWR